MSLVTAWHIMYHRPASWNCTGWRQQGPNKSLFEISMKQLYSTKSDALYGILADKAVCVINMIHYKWIHGSHLLPQIEKQLVSSEVHLKVKEIMQQWQQLRWSLWIVVFWNGCWRLQRVYFYSAFTESLIPVKHFRMYFGKRWAVINLGIEITFTQRLK